MHMQTSDSESIAATAEQWDERTIILRSDVSSFEKSVSKLGSSVLFNYYS